MVQFNLWRTPFFIHLMKQSLVLISGLQCSLTHLFKRGGQMFVWLKQVLTKQSKFSLTKPPHLPLMQFRKQVARKLLLPLFLMEMDSIMPVAIMRQQSRNFIFFFVRYSRLTLGVARRNHRKRRSIFSSWNKGINFFFSSFYK